MMLLLLLLLLLLLSSSSSSSLLSSSQTLHRLVVLAEKHFTINELTRVKIRIQDAAVGDVTPNVTLPVVRRSLCRELIGGKTTTPYPAYFVIAWVFV
jgi:hypothetical protein